MTAEQPLGRVDRRRALEVAMDRARAALVEGCRVVIVVEYRRGRYRVIGGSGLHDVTSGVDGPEPTQ